MADTKVNRFAAAGFGDDSDDDVPVQKQTKTQKKKEDRKITEKAPKTAGAKTMEAGGFEFVSNQPANRNDREGGERGGRGGRGGRGRGGNRGGERGRGGYRGDRRGGHPRGGAKDGNREVAESRFDADGNPIKPRNYARRDNGPGKEGDRQDGTGRGRRGGKRDGHGRGNTGTNEAVAYKQKGANTEGEPVEEEKVAEKVEEPKPEPVVMETIGVSIDDFLTGKSKTAKKEARAAEGIKGSKIDAFSREKEGDKTLIKKSLATHAKASNSEINKMFGFGAVRGDDDDDVPARGGRGGRGRGGRGGDRGGRGARQEGGGGRRQNAKAALKVTDEDFPTL